MKTNQREISARVEFRWRQHEEHFAQLLAQSAREVGRPESEQARELLKSALTQPDQLRHALETFQRELLRLQEQLQHLPSIKAGLRTLHENIYQLRDDLATCVTKLLAEAGDLDPATAEAWVKQALDAD